MVNAEVNLGNLGVINILKKMRKQIKLCIYLEKRFA